MASALTSPYQDDTIREVVPKVAKIAGKLAQSSVITDRRRVRIVPQSGQSYTLGSGGTGTVNFLIQDGAAYADLQSACISFTATVTGAAANTANMLDDGAWSVFRRLLVSVNSTQADDIDRVAVKTNQEIYATCSQSWYDGPGSVMGLWKNSITGTTTAAPATPIATSTVASKYSVNAKAQGESAVSLGTAAATQRYSFPVSLLSNFFRAEQLYPCRNAGQLYLQLQLASNSDATIAFATDAGNEGEAAPAPAVALEDMTLELDYVSLHPAYLEMMDKMMNDPEEAGVHWAYDAHTVGSGVLAVTGGDQSVVFTKASQNLRSIHIVAQPQAALGGSGGNFGKQSTFNNPGAYSVQYRAGSLYFPAFQSIGAARLAMDLFNSHGSPDAVDKASIVDSTNFNQATASAAAGAVPTVRVAAQATGALAVPGTAIPFRANADCWIHGYCFDRLKRAKLEGEDLDGINTLSSSGSQIVAQVNANPAEALTLTGILRYTRVLRLHGGATQILG